MYIKIKYHGIGKEFSYYHAAIVLQNFTGFVQILPITSDEGQTFSQDIEDCIIRVDSQTYSQFDNDSILLTHQIRTIDKNRIRKDLFKSVMGTPLMEQIEEKILQNFSPTLYREKKQAEADLQQKNDQLLVLQQQIEALQNELERFTAVEVAADKQRHIDNQNNE